MKKSFLVLICVLLSQQTWAESVSLEDAQQTALRFLNRQPGSFTKGARKYLPGKNRQLTLAKETRNLYIFNVGQEEGFVVVSGDNQAPAILGYADEGQYNDDDMPENMKAWLQNYNDQIEWLKQHSGQVAKAPALDEHATVKPLLTCSWSQDSPYNNLCPMDNGKRSMTGCVATAMAQILYYHKYPSETLATIPSYTTQTKGITVNAIGITTIDWDHILERYTGSETSTAKNAVAKLMQLCGSSVMMDYTAGSSGAPSAAVPTALKDYFDFDAATSLTDRNYYRAREWNNLIYNELANKRPVFYGGNSSGGGHAFVVDGYDKEGLFHVNWGWGGQNNGYFLLSILDPQNNSGIGASTSIDGYSFAQEAVIGAQPNTGADFHEKVWMSISGISTEQAIVTKSNGVFPVKANLSECYSVSEGTYDIEYGLGIYDNDGKLLYAQSNGHTTLDNWWGWTSIQLAANIPSMPDGVYHITGVSREYGTGTWNRNRGGHLHFLTTTISGNTMKLQEPVIDLDCNMAITGNLEKGSTVTAVTTIKNNGTLFMDQLFLRVNGKRVSGQYFEVDANQTETIEMIFTPTNTGSTVVSLGYNTYNYDQSKGWVETYHELTSKTVNIEAAKTHSLSFSNGKITNAVGKKINDNTVKIQVSVKNNGDYTYNDYIRTHYLTPGNNNYWYYQGYVNTPVEIEKGATKVVNIDVPLTTDNQYWFILVYKSDGEFLNPNDNGYQDLYNYTVVIPEDQTSVKNPHDSNRAGTSQLFDLQGRPVSHAAKKGIYILNGKKIVKP